MRENKPSRRFCFALALLLSALSLPGALTAQSVEGSADSSSGSLVLPHVETMTEDEILAELYAILDRREARLTERERLLTERETALDERENLLSQREKNLTAIETDLQTINGSIQTISATISESESFWTSYVADEKRRTLESFLGGIAVGAGVVGLTWIIAR